MSDKKAIVVIAPALSLEGSGDALAKLMKKACVLVNADAADLAARAEALTGVKCAPAELTATLEKSRLAIVVVAAKEGVAFYGLAVNSKVGKVERKVSADDIALTIATIDDLPITADCTAGIIYQVLKDPNLKLTEITKLEEALERMETVLARNNREPWEKHDCA